MRVMRRMMESVKPAVRVDNGLISYNLFHSSYILSLRVLISSSLSPVSYPILHLFDEFNIELLNE